MKQSYDFVFVLQEKVEDMQKTVKSIVTELGGAVTAEKPWGQKRLAYPIRKKMSGEFFEWTLEMDASVLNEFKKRLSFERDLPRYLLLKKD